MKYPINDLSAKANLRSKLSAACRSQKIVFARMKYANDYFSVQANLRSKLSEAAGTKRSLIEYDRTNRHCEERSDAAIHFATRTSWIATACGLAMTISKK